MVAHDVRGLALLFLCGHLWTHELAEVHGVILTGGRPAGRLHSAHDQQRLCPWAWRTYRAIPLSPSRCFSKWLPGTPSMNDSSVATDSRPDMPD